MARQWHAVRLAGISRTRLAAGARELHRNGGSAGSVAMPGPHDVGLLCYAANLHALPGLGCPAGRGCWPGSAGGVPRGRLR